MIHLENLQNFRIHSSGTSHINQDNLILYFFFKGKIIVLMYFCIFFKGKIIVLKYTHIYFKGKMILVTYSFINFIGKIILLMN